MALKVVIEYEKKIYKHFIMPYFNCSCFAGCGSSNNYLDLIYPFGGNVNSYDPQIASTSDEFLIIEKHI